MFDWIYFPCPKCQGIVETQSQGDWAPCCAHYRFGGDIIQKDTRDEGLQHDQARYSEMAEASEEIIYDMNGDRLTCKHCGAGIEIKCTMGFTVSVVNAERAEV